MPAPHLKGTYSANCCTHCRQNLTLIADKLGMTKCANCLYFETIGVYTITDYNNWLKKNLAISN